MNSLIESIAQEYEKKRMKVKRDKNLFIFTILNLVLTIVFYIVAITVFKLNYPILSALFFVIVIASLIGSVILACKSNKIEKSLTNEKIQNKRFDFKELKLILKNNELVEINDKRDLLNFIKCVEDYYGRKFTFINRLGEINKDVYKALILPMVLFVFQYIFKIEGSANEKSIIIILIIFISLIAIILLEMSWKCAYDYIETNNLKYKILLEDLKIIYHFDIKETNISDKNEIKTEEECIKADE